VRRPLGKRSWYKPRMLPIRSPLLAEHGFRHGFSPRHGGVSAPPYDSLNLGRGVGDDAMHVAENRRRFAEAVGYVDAALFELNQVHGRDVRRVRAGDEPIRVRSEPGDGLVLEASAWAEAGDVNAAVGVRTADCLPVLIGDPETRAVAALHAGWRGTVLGVVPAGLELLRQVSGAPAARLIAAVFPHIGVCCFEVSDEVAGTLAAAADGAPVVRHTAGKKPHVELSAIVRLQLMAAGVPARRIDFIAGCTRCDAAQFFSYRRDGGASGRHLTSIVAG
jgi:YfiH family protein